MVDVVILGAGPGGYSAAFRAADLGLKVALVDEDAVLGGVCLNRGCIPSKALLHAAKIITDMKTANTMGLLYTSHGIDLAQLKQWKNGVVTRLNQGLAALATQRGVQVIQGRGQFESEHTVLVQREGGVERIPFNTAVIATGSRPTPMKGLPVHDGRIWDSSRALDLSVIPPRLLIVGGGIIGLEMAVVYEALGSEVTVIEWGEKLLSSFDQDLVKVLKQHLEKRNIRFLMQTRVEGFQEDAGVLSIKLSHNSTELWHAADAVLVAVGRLPNTEGLNLEGLGILKNAKGFLQVDAQQRTSVGHILAIGDVVDGPMLAHKAVPQGRVVAEILAGLKHFYNPLALPNVCYTDPELAWVGLSFEQAVAQGLSAKVATFPWKANGRAVSMNREEGLTKLVFDEKTHRVLGAGVVGCEAGELIGEMALAIEMGCCVGDLALTIRPHPTRSESWSQVAEVAEGTATDIFIRRSS